MSVFHGFKPDLLFPPSSFVILPTMVSRACGIPQRVSHLSSPHWYTGRLCPPTDISWRWVNPALVDVFTYGLPPTNATSVSLGNTLVQGVITLLEPIVMEATRPIAVLAADVYAYGVVRHTNDADAPMTLLDGSFTQGVLIELLEPIIASSIYPLVIPEPSRVATVDHLPDQAFVQLLFLVNQFSHSLYTTVPEQSTIS